MTGNLILSLGVAIGALVFMLSMGGLEWIEVEGVDNFNQTDFNPESVTILNEINRSEIDSSEGRLEWTGETNDLGEEEGYINFDVSDISGERYIYYGSGSFFFTGVEFILDGEYQSTTGSPQNVDFTGVDTFRIEIDIEDAYVESISASEERTGLDSIGLIIDVFRLNADALWFQLLVGTPLALFGTWLFIKVARGI